MIKPNNYIYYLYQITNKINGKIYIGVHKTLNLEDGYMGSGLRINRAYIKYGIENFEKQILIFFDNIKEMFETERIIVDSEFIKRTDVYNIVEGGKGQWKPSIGVVTIRDENGNTYRVDKNDSNYLSGKYKFIHCNKVLVKDQNNKKFKIDKDDPRYASGMYKSVMFDLVMVKDNVNNHYLIDKTDSRYISGELIPIWLGKHHNQESKNKISNSKLNTGIGKQNSQYDTCCIYCEDIKLNLRIPKKDKELWLNMGCFKLGFRNCFSKNWNAENCKKTKGKIIINKEGVLKYIHRDELKVCLKNGWKKGRKI